MAKDKKPKRPSAKATGKREGFSRSRAGQAWVAAGGSGRPPGDESLGRRLRKIYDDVVPEPVPDDLLEFLAQNPTPREPEWWRGAAMYQIYPRSFMDSNGDGIGDLKGIAAKLDYVASLGVDGVWLSPFFKSPMRDFGYDVSDYRDVDPMFGSLKDFDALLKAAHQRNLKVIIDQVYSHTSSDHPWFQQSRRDVANDKSDWYVWADPKPDGGPPNNWQAWFGGPAWTWEPRRRQYYLHNFLPTQPDLNFRSEAVQQEILDTAKFWLDRGVDGFRLDVANYYVHDAQLRDNPPSGNPAPALPRDMQVHKRNSNQPETLAFIARLRALTDSKGGRMMVGELAPGSRELMQQYTRGPERLHTAYAFDFLGIKPNAVRMAEILSGWSEGRTGGWPSWAFSNHDVARVASRWAPEEGRHQKASVICWMTLLACLRGTIFIYQGEELGLPQGDVPFEKLQDPWGIAGWPATKGRDGCRTPMPWTGEEDGGFTTANQEPWLPVDREQRKLSVAAQLEHRAAPLHYMKALLALRREHAALRRGSLSIVKPDLKTGEGRKGAEGAKFVLEAMGLDDLLVFTRKSGPDEFLCAFNLGPHEHVVENIGVGRFAQVWGQAQPDASKLKLPAYGCYIGGRREGVRVLPAQNRWPGLRAEVKVGREET
jgi:alpha-glucosidase